MATLRWHRDLDHDYGDNNYLPENMVDDDGSLDNALLNYLFARQMVNRLRNNMDVTDLQRKRSYWKQCAFNAVSCFGKK
ncbi:prohormone-1 [Trichonephila clavipes]|nr:prohormone-1 [Trichonephila clavipes]